MGDGEVFEQEEIEGQVPEENIPLILENIGFAQKLARQFYRRRTHFGIEREEYEAAAMLGLCDAAKRFDSRKGMSFKTFCYFRIRGTMFDLLRRGGRMTRQEFHQMVKLNREEATRRSGQGEARDGGKSGGEGDDTSLPYSFARTPSELVSLVETFDEIRIRLHVGPDNQVSDMSYTGVLSPEETSVIRSTREYLKKLVHMLPEPQRRLFELRYWGGLSFEEIRAQFGHVSKSWVSRQHSRGIEMLRRLVAADEERENRAEGDAGSLS